MGEWLKAALPAGFIILGFALLDQEERKACDPGRPCADPRTRRIMKATLWVATALAALFVTFPSWQALVL